jgi:26S proteasome non-ATPase regulatory subunit 10
MVAAGAGHAAVVAVLLARGASVVHVDAGGRCAVHHAAVRGRPNIVRALLAALHTSHVRFTSQQQLGDLPIYVKGDNRGRTPLHLAAEKGHFAVIEALLARCADGAHPVFGDTQLELLEAPERAGQTALLMAVERGHAAASSLLLIHGAACYCHVSLATS